MPPPGPFIQYDMCIEPGWSKCTVTQVEEGRDNVVLDPLAESTWISWDSEWTGMKMAASKPATAITTTTVITSHKRRRFGFRPKLGSDPADMPIRSP